MRTHNNRNNRSSGVPQPQPKLFFMISFILFDIISTMKEFVNKETIKPKKKKNAREEEK